MIVNSLRNILETSWRPGFNRMCWSHSQRPQAHPLCSSGKVTLRSSYLRILSLLDLRLSAESLPRLLQKVGGAHLISDARLRLRFIQSQHSGGLSGLASPKATWMITGLLTGYLTSFLGAPGTVPWLLVPMGKVSTLPSPPPVVFGVLSPKRTVQRGVSSNVLKACTKGD